MTIYDKHCPTLNCPPKDECDFCSEKMIHGNGGHWRGQVEMLCCPRCAINILPIFLADSIYAKNLDEAQNKISGRVMATLQRALASRAEWKNWNGPAHTAHLDARARARDSELIQMEIDAEARAGRY